MLNELNIYSSFGRNVRQLFGGQIIQCPKVKGQKTNNTNPIKQEGE